MNLPRFFTIAALLLGATGCNRTDYSWESDLQHRLAIDFCRTRAEVTEYIHKYIPEANDSMITAWTNSGKLEAMTLDGELRYFKNAALFVEVQPQEILASLPDIFHVPQLTPLGLHNGAGEFRHQFCHLHWLFLLKAKKKERRLRLSLPTFYRLTGILYHRIPRFARGFLRKMGQYFSHIRRIIVKNFQMRKTDGEIRRPFPYYSAGLGSIPHLDGFLSCIGRTEHQDWDILRNAGYCIHLYAYFNGNCRRP